MRADNRSPCTRGAAAVAAGYATRGGWRRRSRGREGADPATRYRAGLRDGVHCLAHPRSKLWHAERTAAVKARHANANFNVNAQLGMGLGVSSVSCEVNDGNRRRPGRDVVAFSCGQGNLAIQTQTHDIDLSYPATYLYPEKFGKAQER